MMNHIGTNSIETIRLILRRFRPEDAYDMYNNWASDKDTLKFVSWGPHTDINVTYRRILSWVESYKQPNIYYWAIYLKSDKQVIGSISVEISNDRDESCEIGYCIGRKYWGREIVLEALRAVMHYLFYEVDIGRLLPNMMCSIRPLVELCKRLEWSMRGPYIIWVIEEMVVFMMQMCM